jgi:uncharacterized small protein (DUF1192 family)
MSTMTVPASVYVKSLERERAGYEQQLPRRPELADRIAAVNAEIARVTGKPVAGDASEPTEPTEPAETGKRARA